MASGEGVWDRLLERPPKMELWRFGGDNGDGESGDLGDELGDLGPRRNLEGDLESERRMDLTADVTSTW